MMIGTGPLAPGGSVIGTVKSMLLPPFSTCTLICVLLTEPVTVVGGPGFAPKMYFSTTAFISARRQRQSDRLDIVVPSSFVKRLGSWPLMLTSLGVATLQSEPENSTKSGLQTAALLVPPPPPVPAPPAPLPPVAVTEPPEPPDPLLAPPAPPLAFPVPPVALPPVPVPAPPVPVVTPAPLPPV